MRRIKIGPSRGQQECHLVGEEGGGVGEVAECIRGDQLSADSLRDLTIRRVLHAQSSTADSTCGQQPLASLGSIQGGPGCPSELQVEAAHRPSWTHIQPRLPVHAHSRTLPLALCPPVLLLPDQFAGSSRPPFCAFRVARFSK